jgi:hypothetical protein
VNLPLLAFLLLALPSIPAQTQQTQPNKLILLGIGFIVFLPIH